MNRSPRPRHALRLFAWAAQLRLTVASAYLLCVLAAARNGRADAEEQGAEGLRVIVLIPAHDEEQIITTAVASLLAQDYPSEGYEIVVVADNCSDGTVREAERAGATAWRREQPDHPGKGPALAWGLDRVWRLHPDTEVVVILDADCLASPNLLRLLVGALDAGADAAQADYAVSNADASSLSALRAAGFSLKHRVRARGRRRLGLSPGLFGTGMAFSRELLTELPWSASVTEDTELYLRIVEAGRRIAYVGGAAVTSPMPTTADTARSQQLRWETGNSELRRARLVRLAWRGVRERDRERLGAAAELALPSQSAQFATQAGVLVGAALLRDRRLAAWGIGGVVAQATFVAAGLASADSVDLLRRGARDLPAFLLTRTRVLTRVFAGGGAASWERTSRGETTPVSAPEPGDG